MRNNKFNGQYRDFDMHVGHSVKKSREIRIKKIWRNKPLLAVFMIVQTIVIFSFSIIDLDFLMIPSS